MRSVGRQSRRPARQFSRLAKVTVPIALSSTLPSRTCSGKPACVVSR
jgi:hypothetical protein